MIGYTTLGTNDLAKASAFYDALLSEMGGTRIIADDHITAWSDETGKGMVAVIKPFNDEPATIGNGSMIALAVDSPEMVTKMHAKAMSLGCTDEGAPGSRSDGIFFMGYVRDPEGHKLAFFNVVHAPE